MFYAISNFAEKNSLVSVEIYFWKLKLGATWLVSLERGEKMLPGPGNIIILGKKMCKNFFVELNDYFKKFCLSLFGFWAPTMKKN